MDPDAGDVEVDVEEDAHCGRPCDPSFRNACCTEYWARMVDEGLWDADRRRWTEKGFKEATK